MRDGPVLDGGTRFPEPFTLRLPGGFLERIRAAATGEGISPQDFARRAIADRLTRSTAPGGPPASPNHPTTETERHG